MRPGWLMNLALKLLSLLLAFCVWFVVSAPRREPVSERAFAAPLSLVRMPRNLVITTPVPDTVTVRLRGRASNLRSLSSQNLEVTLDLNWVSAGEASITLGRNAIAVPPEIEVVSMEPSKVRFRVEQIRQKVVAVRPFLVGQPPSGYLAGDPTANPDHVLVSGPLSLVRNLQDVATERIIMTGRTDTFVQNVSIVTDSPLIRAVDPNTTQVTVPVTAEIGPQPSPTTTTDNAAEPEPTTATVPPPAKETKKGKHESAVRH
jgi:YbbR domain-containing protein